MERLNGLIDRTREEMESLPVGSEEFNRAAESYVNLVKARSELLKTREDIDSTWSKIRRCIEICGPWVGPILLGVGKFYEVWARRRTNQEAMYVEEVAAKYIPKTPWNNK